MLPNGKKRKRSTCPDPPTGLSDEQTRYFAGHWKKIDILFDRYKCSENMIDPQGIQALCSDLKLPHTDIRILRLAWRMKAESQGFFSRNEWRRGLATLLVDGIKGLRKTVGEDNEVLTESELKDFYEYAFHYSITEDRQKFLDIESICVLLELLLQSQYRHQVRTMVAFLKVQKSYKVISFDQWSSFLLFFRQVSFPDFKNYRADDAWPVIIDEFVECVKKFMSSN